MPSQVVLIPGPRGGPNSPMYPCLGVRTQTEKILDPSTCIPRYFAHARSSPDQVPRTGHPPSLASLACISRRSWHQRHENGDGADSNKMTDFPWA